MLTPTPVLQSLEVTCIVVNLHKGPIKITPAYNLLNRRLVADDLDRVFDSNIPVIAGDFNNKHPAWNSSKSNPHKKVLLEYIEKRKVIALGPVEPIQVPNNHAHPPDVLDIAVPKAISYSTDV